MEFLESSDKASARSAAALGQELSNGSVVAMELGSSVPRPRRSDQWNAEGLANVLLFSGSYSVSKSLPRAGTWLARSSEPRILLLENRSSVHPLSRDLKAWDWRFKVADFEQVESDPGSWLDPSRIDVVVFSSPGWWGHFANPPSGPSRLPDPVAEKMRGFVRKGGTALFLDIAQWDLEKAWPKSLRLANLGPYQLSDFRSPGVEGEGRLALAPFGVAPEKIFQRSFASLFSKKEFSYPDGNEAPLFAAYAFPDPERGSGFVAGLAYHPFDQDDSFSGRARRIVLNLFLASGARRIVVSGDSRLDPASAPTPENSATPVLAPTEVATEEPTLTATALPTVVPTRTSSPVPSRTPTPHPTWKATIRPTMEPTRPLPTATPSVEATPSSTRSSPFHSALGCLRSSPEPFSEGGVYIFFCLKKNAVVRLRVFDALGTQVFAGGEYSFAPGNSHFSYMAEDDTGKGLKPGLYLYRVEARYRDQPDEWKQGRFNFRKSPGRRL